MTAEKMEELIEEFCDKTGAGYAWKVIGASFSCDGAAQQALCEFLA